MLLDKDGYWCSPSSVYYEKTETSSRCIAEDFEVGHVGFGRVMFPGATDISELNLNKIVHIGKREIEMYPGIQDEPPVGHGLNKRAFVTFENVFEDRYPKRSKEQFELKLCNSIQDKGGRFISYNEQTGELVFEVQHFSKFHLDDSDEETENTPVGQSAGETFLIKPGIGTTATEVSLTAKNAGDTFLIKQAKSYSPNAEGDTYIVNNQPRASRGLGGPVEVGNFSSRGFQDILEDEETDEPDDVDHPPIHFDNYSVLQSQLGLPYSNLKQMSSLFPSDESLSRKRYAFNDSTMGKKPRPSYEIRAEKIIREERANFQSNASCTSDFLPEIASIDLNSAESDERLTADQSSCIDLRISSRSCFRASWTANNRIIHPHMRDCDQKLAVFESVPKSQSLQVQPVLTISGDSMAMWDNLFEVQLEHSVSSLTENPSSIMYQTPDFADALSECTIDFQPLQDAVSLSRVLFGNHGKQRLSDSPTSYENRQCRRDAFSDWLGKSGNLESFVLPKGLSNKELVLFKILLHLTANQREHATELALSSDLKQLALLIAQDCSLDMQKCLSYMLQEWEQNGVVNYQNASWIKILGLLSGHVVSPTNGSDGFNVCENLGWKRCFGAVFWYTCFRNSSIGDALDRYDDMFRTEVASWPVPPHAVDSEDRTYLDCCYHLMRLYMDSTYNLDLAVNPLSFGPYLCDYTSSWFLYSVLQSLGYLHFEEETKLSIIANFASQLEAAGRWHWAIFVHLFNPSDHPRQHAVVSILQRNCSSSKHLTDTEEFVVDRLHLDRKWVFKAKAHRAEIEGDRELLLRHLLNAKSHKEAHELLMDGLSAEFFFNHKSAILINSLKALSFASLPDWDERGGILHEYFQLQKSRQLLQETTEKGELMEDSAESLAMLHQSFLSLAHRFKRIEVKNSMMRSFISDLAESVVQSIRMLDEESAFSTLVPLLGELPLLQDSARFELSLLAPAALPMITGENY